MEVGSEYARFRVGARACSETDPLHFSKGYILYVALELHPSFPGWGVACTCTVTGDSYRMEP